MVKKLLSVMLALSLYASVMVGCDQNTEGNKDAVQSDDASDKGTAEPGDEASVGDCVPLSFPRDPWGENCAEFKWGENDCEMSIDGNTVWRFEYNDDATQVKWIEYDSDGSIESYCEYDGDGKLRKDVCYNSDGGVQWHYEYEYDKSSNMTKREKYTSDGDIKCRCEYDYDASGHLTSLSTKNFNESIFRRYRQYRFKWVPATQAQYKVWILMSENLLYSW